MVAPGDVLSYRRAGDRGVCLMEIEIKGATKLSSNLRRSREEVLIATNNALREMGKLLVPSLKKVTPVGATSKLRNYTVFQVLGTAEDMRLEVRQSAKSTSGYPYGAAVRGGTRPHFPPVDALIPWVRKKLGVPENRARSVAYLIARKISRVGTKPNPYHVDVVRQNMGELTSIARKWAVNLVGKLAQT